MPSFYEHDNYKNPIEGKTYISPPIQSQYGEQKTIRIITRCIDQQESYETAKIKDEIVLRKTKGGKKVIIAKVIEDSHGISVLNIQEFTPDTGNPHKLGFAFIGDEITKLFNFIRDVQTMRFGSQRYQQLSDDSIEHLDLSDVQALRIVQNNPKLFASIMQSNITSQDIVAVAYRKQQLKTFENLLSTNALSWKSATKSVGQIEKKWQTFFEKNHWIFGYGLGYVFLSGLDGKKLEQVAQGFSLAYHGKRIDAVMKTMGFISSLCFVEMKTHMTKLLEESPYRPGCYAPSRELAGAISQVQISVADATRTIVNKLSPIDRLGNPTGEEIYNYRAKSFLVIGHLNEFSTDNGVNEDKLRSFELLRKNIVSPEIITFDELYERARFIVENNESTTVKK